MKSSLMLEGDKRCTRLEDNQLSFSFFLMKKRNKKRQRCEEHEIVSRTHVTSGCLCN